MRLGAFVCSELVEVSATLHDLGEARTERARRAYFDAVRAAVAAAHGREVEAAGDRLLAVFDSASDALAFAHDVVRACEREGRRSRELLDVRLGIEVGEADLDDPAALRSPAAVARAQRLARAAAANGVLVSSVVGVLAARGGARFVPAGLMDVGEPEPVPALEVAWEQESAAQPPLPPELEPRPLSGFVGRATERQRLDAAWRAALRCERQLAFLSGEPGIGKTRLAREFARDLHGEGAAVLWGRCFEEALSPYQPFLQALRHHVRTTALEELRTQVGVGGEVLARLLPELETRLGLRPVPTETADPERLRLFEAVGALFGAASAEWPLLLVLDDLQWADRGTLLLLKHLARDPAPAPLLILGTYRHSEVGRDHPLALVQADVERDRIVERIALSGLAEDEVGRLVGALIGWEPPEDVLRGLRAETQGNPFFLEELVRHLDELGLGGDPTRLARLEELGVPARVRELVLRRVQRLPPATQAALAAAAVVGSRFDTDVLAEVVEAASAPHLVDVLDEAVAAGLLVESPEQVGRYGFAHALVRQALYEEQTLNHRAALHEQVAVALERLRPDDERLDAALARHYSRAGDRHAAKVVRHGRVAAQRAFDLFAYEDAIGSLSTALAALDRLPADEPAERATILALLGTAQTRAGSYEDAKAAIAKVAELAVSSGDWRTLAGAALEYGRGTAFGGIWESHGLDTELVQLLELALRQCPPADSAERARLLGRLAQALYWPREKRALALSEEAIEIARRLDDPRALADALDARHVVVWDPEHLDEGQALAEEMLRIGRQLGDREIQLKAHGWLVPDALERGRIAEVDELLDEYRRLAAELRHPYHLWFGQVIRVTRAHLAGRLAEAEELCEHAYAYGAQAHRVNASQVRLVQTLELQLERGAGDENLFGDSLDDPSVLQHPFRHAVRAQALARLGRRDEARAQLSPLAERGFASVPMDCLWSTVIVALARAASALDEHEYADDLYTLLLPFADRVLVTGGAVFCFGPASLTLGLLARTAGRPDDALGHLADALERSRALGSPPFTTATLVETAKAHVLRGRDEDGVAAAACLDEAVSTARAIGIVELAAEADGIRESLPRSAVA